MNCTRCGYYDRSNRKYKFVRVSIVVDDMTSSDYFLCERCEEYSYRSLDDLNPPASSGQKGVCQYCGNEEIKDYRGLTFTDLIVRTASGRLFPADYTAKLHRECAGYIFNKLPVRYDGTVLSEKWFSPRRPYVVKYDEHEQDDD